MSKPQRERGVLFADRNAGCLLGLAVGDAVGTTLEFRPKGSFEPTRNMVGGGPFQLKAGEWTDDTSMALCLAQSLIECKGFDARDQMEKYCRWVETGYLSSNGKCFDVGTTVMRALKRFKKSGNPYSGCADERSQGNGSLMRLAPIPMFYNLSADKVIEYCGESSKTTHAVNECVDACRLFGIMLKMALDGGWTKEEILKQTAYKPTTPTMQGIAEGNYFNKTVEQIHGTGYVVQSLEAALWCFYTTESYGAAILSAANLGDDADTTAAICGQLAGAFYGASAIPQEWLDKLVMRNEIESMARQLMEVGHIQAGHE
jgi:ADP-ribosyl-[dinitrogen reductase] hydrolase